MTKVTGEWKGEEKKWSDYKMDANERYGASKNYITRD